MSKTMILWLALALVGTGCAAMETMLGNLTSPAGSAQAGEGVETVAKAAGLDPLTAGGIGSAATALLGFVGTFVAERKKRKKHTARLYEKVETLERNGGGQPSSPSPPPPA